jgi:hypothetical protein
VLTPDTAKNSFTFSYLQGFFIIHYQHPMSRPQNPVATVD